MTEQATSPELEVKCKRCSEVTKLGQLTKFQSLSADVIEWYLECPKCKLKTHSYFMTSDLLQRNKRLQELSRLFHANQTPGRWTTYESARRAYSKAFAEVQNKLKNRRIHEAEQIAV